MQFHPEYTSEYTVAFNERSNASRGTSSKEFAYQISAQKLERHH
jgi:hypothetical protein